MENYKFENMVNGWFVGNFVPTALKTESAEVAVKSYSAGDVEPNHFHKIATEVTLVLSGKVEMCGRIWGAGSVIVLEPGEATAFKALEDSVNVVVKLPSVLGDKYIVD